MSKYIKNSFLEDFSNEFERIKINKGDVVNLDDTYLDLIAELVGKSSNRSVFFVKEDEECKKDIIKSNTITVGDTWDINLLLELGYEVVERVWNEGEVSILGESIIIWPFSSKNLIRILLWGKEVEDIDAVEVESRRKVSGLDRVVLFEKSDDALVGNENKGDVEIIKYHSVGFNKLDSDIDIEINKLTNLNIHSNSKASFNILKDYKDRGFKIWYLTKDILKYDDGLEISEYLDRVYEIKDSVEESVKSGFVYPPSKIVVLTDSELLGEVKLKTSKREKVLDISTIDLLKKIIPNDYVVHEDHGVGKYLGLTDKDGSKYLEIAYAGEDRLFIPLKSSDKVMKYIGSGKATPRLTGLNSGVWKRISKKAKEDVENIAKELIQIYAMREVIDTSAVIDSEEDVSEFWKFVDSFEFRDTEDQYIATKHILNDLSSEKPMDRLIVGDVGFGKTEIAMRSAFGVVNSGMQVAVLAPTTVLASQHERVFRERFKDYPFVIRSLSRLQSKSEKEKILTDLKKGKIDILIGTHALISDSVIFKNLGLIVIDEEQKFGVKQKEALKRSRVNTHVLSMTATPIPRTLNMALMGVRDISVLVIPPSGRRDIRNEFSIFDWDKITFWIDRELKRGGQVYFLHNRVDNIEFVKREILKRFPNIRVEIAHGRLNGKDLIEKMNKFVNHDVDLLLCTTIIENGLDISNANTLIIDDVNQLGLSQMYQIRGRVGRGDKQAYACFMFDKLRGDSALRLEAIRESEGLGSGYVLSNRDLEIRGAGDILGKKQSGTINTVGYGLYTQLLKEAIGSLKIKS